MPTRSRPLPTRSAVPEHLRGGGSPATTEPVVDPAVTKPFTDPNLISEPQWKYICDMLGYKDLTQSNSFFDKTSSLSQEEYDTYMTDLKEKLKFIPKRRASEVIEALKALPRLPKEVAEDNRHIDRQDFPQVPAGRYALPYPQDETNPIRFYRVADGKDNRAKGGRDWTGCKFLERFFSDDTFAIKYGSSEYNRVMTEIAGDPLAAAQRYGDEFERCCICNRGLTRHISRKMRIGPVCLRKHGEAWGLDPESYIAENRAELEAQGIDPDGSVKSSRNRQHLIGE